MSVLYTFQSTGMRTRVYAATSVMVLGQTKVYGWCTAAAKKDYGLERPKNGLKFAAQAVRTFPLQTFGSYGIIPLRCDECGVPSASGGLLME